MPNPQNTAEVVCALLDARKEVPHLSDVVALLQQDEVFHPRKDRKWSFANNIDIAWRLQALLRLRDLHGAVVDDATIDRLAKMLQERQATDGSWAFSESGLGSVVATALAVEALSMFRDGSADRQQCVTQGLDWLHAYVRDASISEGVFALSRALRTLSLNEVLPGQGAASGRLLRRRADHILNHMKETELGIEEEIFQRGNVQDCWRHLSLPMALEALVRVAPRFAFEPAFRRSLIRLMELQEPRGPSHGGVRTSPEGFVTSYATSLYVSTLAVIQKELNHGVSGAATFDFICQNAGLHHTDAHEIGEIGDSTILANSTATQWFFWTTALLSLSLLLVSLPRVSGISLGVRKLLTLEALLGLSVSIIGVYKGHHVDAPLLKVAVVVFSTMTGVALPLVVWVIA